MDVTSNDQLQASTLPPWRERWVRVQGLRVRVLDGGQGPAVLFLHGVGGWAENWRDLLPVVARAGYRVLACDLPGFGHSEAPPPTRYFEGDSPFYVTFVSGLLDELRLHQVTLVGHSMGGAVAMMVAATEPWRVQRLVLIAP